MAPIDDNRRSIGVIKDRRRKAGVKSADLMGVAAFGIDGGAGLDRGDGAA